MRSLPATRLLAILSGSSILVKCLWGAVLFLYLISLWVNTPYALGVTPGLLLPPNLWLWTLATHGLVEVHIWDVLLNLLLTLGAGRRLEPLWGAPELLIFYVLVNVAVGILSSLCFVAAYAATSDLHYLFHSHIHGFPAFAGAVLVAHKQTVGDGQVEPQRWVRALPQLVLLGLTVLTLISLAPVRLIVGYSLGMMSGWVYLRFYQRHSRGRGDMSDHFSFASFFPGPVQPAAALLANLVHAGLVKVRLCPRAVKRYDVGAPSSITISLPGTDPQDAERRRQLALKALNERLKCVEDQTSWPSMEEEEDEDSGREENSFNEESSTDKPEQDLAKAPQQEAMPHV
ncbi:transmembrane protein 115 [Bombina bombina]|uniref:transmembrane protein 115 n=1 Tax=Bombina bombina TaxID=8345 RepID=UPI00235AC45F|nr:transmembrane protein 115 [Bombina bombina]